MVTAPGFLWALVNECVERRHGESIKFLFLSKMGLLVMKKKSIVNYEPLLMAVFSCFHGQKFDF